MRILVLTPTFLPMVGGAELLLVEVYSRLAERHQICLLTADKGLPPSDLDQRINFSVVRYQDRWSLMKLKGHRLMGGFVPPFSFSAVTATRQAIADFSPDVLNVHFMKHTGLAAILAQKQSRLPTVLSLIGRDVPGPKTPWFWKYYHRWVIQQVADVTYISDYCRQAIFPALLLPSGQASGEAAPRNGHIIPAGVNLKRFHAHLSSNSIREQFDLPPNAPLLFAMQRLSPEKRVDILIRAMPEVLRRHPQALLLIGGTGDSLSDLTSLVQELDLEDSVRFVGYISDADLPFYYAMADIFVFHSIYETFGIVLAEAMAVGKPIVSVNSTAIPDVITDGETGILVPPLNPQQIARQIVYLLNHPAERARLGRNARRWAERHFDWDSIADQYEAVLQGAIP